LEAEGVFRTPDCSRFERELTAYLEGEASPLIAAHSLACAPCGALLADLQSIQQAARDLPLEEPSRAVWANVRARLEVEGAFRTPICSRFEQELAAYLEGEASPLVAAHSRACASCGSLLADLESIQQAARDLPQEEPSLVVWANVRARLEAEGAFRAPAKGWWQALTWHLVPQAVPLGILAVLVFLGSVLTLPSSTSQRWDGAEQVASLPAVTQFAPALPAGEDSTLAGVVSDLEVSYRANEASMAPDLKATYEKSLVSLDGSIRECLDSLQHEPRNTLAHEYLLTAYTRKAEILSSALESDGR
jgi:hypothetical protein